MIIKKPYAFMIKHFRLIHLVLSLLLAFLVYKTSALFKFFNDYANNGYYTYSNNLVSSYINLFMFISVILVILIAGFVFLLMRWKKKSRTIYLSTIIFYLVFFFALFFYFNLFNTILNKTLDIKLVRAYRDIITLLYFPQYIFLVVSVVRAIGFNIKKFDFKKDLEDLDISEEDAEEIEITFGQNSYKYKRSIRKLFRELRYYIVENKYFFMLICSGISLVIILTIFIGINKTKTYRETKAFNIDGVIFKVNESYITNIDYRGNVIDKDKKYLIINTSMENTNIGKVNVDTKNLQLVISDKYYYPTYSKNDYFIDLGEGYNRNTLYSGDIKDYLLVYEIPNDIQVVNPLFRLINNVSIVKGELQANTMNVKLKPIDYIKIEDNKVFSIGDIIGLEESTLSDSEFLVSSYQISDEFIENYSYCISECYNGKKIIQASTLGKGKRTIIKFETNETINEDLYINRYLTSSANFIKLFGSLNYKIDNKVINSYFSIKDLGNIKTNNVYVEVPEEIKNASDIYLTISIRNRKYIINLKNS